MTTAEDGFDSPGQKASQAPEVKIEADGDGYYDLWATSASGLKSWHGCFAHHDEAQRAAEALRDRVVQHQLQPILGAAVEWCQHSAAWAAGEAAAHWNRQGHAPDGGEPCEGFATAADWSRASGFDAEPLRTIFHRAYAGAVDATNPRSRP